MIIRILFINSEVTTTPAQIEIWLKLFKDQKYKSIKSQEDFDKFQKSFVAEF